MTKHVLPVMAIAVLSASVAACRIDELGPDDSCERNPTACGGNPTSIDTCFSDTDCGWGHYCNQSAFACVSSTTCYGAGVCPVGFRCDARSTCIPVSGVGVSGDVDGAGGARGGGAANDAGGCGGGSAANRSRGAGGSGTSAVPPTCVSNVDCAAASCCISGSCQPRSGGSAPLCQFDSECGSAAHCRNGACEQTCASSVDCGTGDVCANGSCRENPASAGQCVYNADCAGVGHLCVNGACRATCTADSQCGPRDRCGGGYCQADHRPHPQCLGNGDCGGGQICVNAVCRNTCASSGDCCTCGSARVCQAGLCVTPGEAAPMCRLAADCGPQQSCLDGLCARW